MEDETTPKFSGTAVQGTISHLKDSLLGDEISGMRSPFRAEDFNSAGLFFQLSYWVHGRDNTWYHRMMENKMNLSLTRGLSQNELMQFTTAA